VDEDFFQSESNTFKVPSSGRGTTIPPPRSLSSVSLGAGGGGREGRDFSYLNRQLDWSSAQVEIWGFNFSPTCGRNRLAGTSCGILCRGKWQAAGAEAKDPSLAAARPCQNSRGCLAGGLGGLPGWQLAAAGLGDLPAEWRCWNVPAHPQGKHCRLNGHHHSCDGPPQAGQQMDDWTYSGLYFPVHGLLRR
jgi:hypothetical protein